VFCSLQRAAAVDDAEAERARRSIESAGTERRDGGPETTHTEIEREGALHAKEAGECAVEEMVRVIHLRADYTPAMLKVKDVSPKKDKVVPVTESDPE
tara:strand:- start:210 stop:503 length:294 start_codon:yes stop_codon:yes gene_type:complete